MVYTVTVYNRKEKYGYKEVYTPRIKRGKRRPYHVLSTQEKTCTYEQIHCTHPQTLIYGSRKGYDMYVPISTALIIIIIFYLIIKNPLVENQI